MTFGYTAHSRGSNNQLLGSHSRFVLDDKDDISQGVFEKELCYRVFQTLKMRGLQYLFVEVGMHICMKLSQQNAKFISISYPCCYVMQTSSLVSWTYQHNLCVLNYPLNIRSLDLYPNNLFLYCTLNYTCTNVQLIWFMSSSRTHLAYGWN